MLMQMYKDTKGPIYVKIRYTNVKNMIPQV